MRIRTTQGLIIAIVLRLNRTVRTNAKCLTLFFRFGIPAISIWGLYITNRNLNQLRAAAPAAKSSSNEEDLAAVSNAGDLYMYVSIAYFKYIC
jgi:hypothetical protein